MSAAFAMVPTAVDWLEPVSGNASVAWGGSSSDVWPVLVHAGGAYKASSLVSDLSCSFAESPGTLTVSLVPTDVGELERTDAQLNVTWTDDTWPVGASGTIGYGSSS